MTHAGEAAIPVEKGGLIEDVVDSLFRPAKLYDRNRNGGFVRPALIQMILLLVISVAAMNLLKPFWHAEMMRPIQKAAEAGKPMPENAVAMMEKMSTATSLVAPALSPWFIALLGGLFVWIASRVVGARMTYRQSAMVASWSYMPAILGMITMAIFGLILDPATIRGVADAQLGPARFVDPNTMSPAVLGLLQQLDLFGIWGIVLTAVGISVVARVDRSSGFIAALIRFAIGAGITLLMSLLRAGG